MQKAKVADGGSAAGLFLDRDGLTSGTLFKAKYLNDNWGNLFELVTNEGYTLIDDDLSQITKAVRGRYNATYTYNTASIASQSVNDIVLGSDGNYYECLTNATTGDDPVGSVTGNWRIIPNFELLMNTATINVAADADITLTTAQNQYGRFVITDTGTLLTTTRNVIVGTAQKRFLVKNNTAKSLVFKTSAGTGITVVAGAKADLYCDGTNVINLAIDMSYNNDTSLFIANTLPSGAIIEIGSNANGDYIKYADGTLICKNKYIQSVAVTTAQGALYSGVGTAKNYPHTFISEPSISVRVWAASTANIIGGGRPGVSTSSAISFTAISVVSITTDITFDYIAIGKWK